MPAKLVIGVDVGGTKIQAGLISPTGRILKRATRPTETSAGKKAILRNIQEAIDEVNVSGIKGIGIGIAGMVDGVKGIYRMGPNFPKSFRNIPLAKLFSRKYRVPVRIDNDVHCFILAESVHGAGKGKKSVVGITLGTGIGGGIVIDGQLFRGAHNAAGELGHMTIDASSKAVCGCGMIGHFESLASGTAMAKLFTSLTGKKLMPIEVEEAAKHGNAMAKKVIKKMSEGLAAGLASVIHFIDPEMIVVGGGVAKADILWLPALTRAKKLIIFPKLRKTPIVRSALGSDAVVLGAGLLTRR